MAIIVTCLNPSDWVAMASVFIALLALSLTFWQAHLSRKHNSLSLRPILSASYNTRKADEMHDFTGVRLNNKGLGPALIRSVDIYESNGVVTSLTVNTSPKILNRFGLSDGPYYLYQVHGALDLLTAGASLKLLYVPQKDLNSERLEKLATVVKEFRAVIFYESVYGERFQLVISGNSSPLPKDLVRAASKKAKSMPRLGIR